jgi:uncharacterized membrane protein
VTTGDVAAERIAWASVQGGDVVTSGEVLFTPAPGGRGTEVRVTLRYDMPAGALGKAVAKYFGDDPSQALDDDLRRFKQVLEIGEVVVSDATLLGTGYMSQRAGQPASAKELEGAEMLPSETATNYGSEGRYTQR